MLRENDQERLEIPERREDWILGPRLDAFCVAVCKPTQMITGRNKMKKFLSKLDSFPLGMCMNLEYGSCFLPKDFKAGRFGGKFFPGHL